MYLIIGGGPAGLPAAYELTKYDTNLVLLEQLDKVGGLARTENYKGYYFDIGGHRFYSKSHLINRMWKEVLGSDLLLCSRLSRIFYRGKYYRYPLKIMSALWGLGIMESLRILLSYFRWQLLPYKAEDTFEQWVTNRFGKRLFQTFFKSYTEKVWGISCSELRAEWAAQRIKNLSLKAVVLNDILKSKTNITSLIEEFYYPRFGPGMMWNRIKELIERENGRVHLSSEVIEIHREENRIVAIEAIIAGRKEIIRGDYFISTLPISKLIRSLPQSSGQRFERCRKIAVSRFLRLFV